MAPVTDLTFDQLVAQSATDQEIFFIGQDVNGNIGVLMSIPALLNDSVEDLTTNGVVKMITRLLDMCRRAQKEVNSNQVSGEKLNAFPEAVVSATVEDGFLEITHGIQTKLVISTASDVVGQNI